MTTANTPRANDQFEHSLLSSWLDQADVGLCVLDDTARVVTLNAASARLLGIDPLNALNMPVTRVMEKMDANASDLQWLGNPGTEGERTLRRVGGDTASTPDPGESSTVHLLLKTRNVKNPAGDRFKVVAITDITATLQAQQALAFMKRQWEALNAGVVISDARATDMPIIYVNPIFERMSGYTAEEIMGRNCRFLQGNDNKQPALDSIRHAIRNQTNGHAVLRNYRKDGSMFLNELFISPVKDAAGVVTHFVGVQHPRGNAAVLEAGAIEAAVLEAKP